MASLGLPPPVTRLDIFVSHSSRQKGFTKDLVNRLSSMNYSVFFHGNNDSLSPGHDFAPRIISSATTCKLAIVVISRDFLTSRWPMMELCEFADRLSLEFDRSPDAPAAPTFTIMPLFFRLSPEDINAEENINEWRKAWVELEQQDDRISAAKCEEAVTKRLRCLNGVVRRAESEQGEATYIEDVVERIMSVLLPQGRAQPFQIRSKSPQTPPPTRLRATLSDKEQISTNSIWALNASMSQASFQAQMMRFVFICGSCMVLEDQMMMQIVPYAVCMVLQTFLDLSGR